MPQVTSTPSTSFDTQASLFSYLVFIFRVSSPQTSYPMPPPPPPPVDFFARVSSTHFSVNSQLPLMPVLEDVCTPEQQLNRLHTSFLSFGEEVFERLDKLERLILETRARADPPTRCTENVLRYMRIITPNDSRESSVLESSYSWTRCSSQHSPSSRVEWL